MTTDTSVMEAADRLIEAATTGRPCAPVRELLVNGDLATGYAVQQRILARAAADGRSRSGRKIGLTSPAVQAQMGVDQPDFGVLFADMARTSGETVDHASLLQPRIEAEIAFVLGVDLDGPLTDAALRDAVAWVVPALEIVDSRILGWDIRLVDTVADNASCGLYVLGERVAPGDLDLREVAMTMTDGTGTVVSSGRGADCLGDPLAALGWLAATTRDFGDPLRAGEVVLSGALGPMVGVRPGDRFTSHLVGLGDVTVAFSAAGDGEDRS